MSTKIKIPVTISDAQRLYLESRGVLFSAIQQDRSLKYYSIELPEGWKSELSEGRFNIITDDKGKYIFDTFTKNSAYESEFALSFNFNLLPRENIINKENATKQPGEKWWNKKLF
ncbi:MAG: hypothetical protein WCK98_06705 [bacterium]